MNKTKLGILAAVILISAGLFNAPGVTSSLSVNQEEQVLIYGLPYDFGEYSYFTTDSYATAQWAYGAVYKGLYARSAANDRLYAPAIADGEPTVSDDALVWTVDIKPDLEFPDGEPLTAEDVVFSYKALLTPAINTNTYGGLAQRLTSNDSVELVDEDTVRFTLDEPYAFMQQGVLAEAIIEQEVWQDAYDACIEGDTEACSWNAEDGSDARGYGPYLVESIDTTNQVVTLVKNPTYHDADNVWAGKIIYKKIESKEAAISELSDGTIDIMDSQYVPGVQEFEGIDGITETFVGDPAHQEISLNHLNPYWGTGESIPDTGDVTDDVEQARIMRNAMSLIIDRESLVDEILEGLGQPAATTMPSASIGWDADLEADPFDVTLAREMMESIGFDYTDTDIDLTDEDSACSDADNCFFTTHVMSPNTNPARNEWSKIYVSQLPKLGIHVSEHVSTGWDEIIPRTFGYADGKPPNSFADGGYEIFFVGYSWDLDFDPAGLYDPTGLCDTGSCDNFYNYENATITEAVNSYLTELDFDARIEQVEAFQAMFAYEKPVIPLLYPQSHWGWSDDLQGIDSLLISVSAQEWENVKKSGWSEVAEGSIPEGYVEGGFLPISTNYFVLGLFAASLIAVFARKRRD